MWTFVLCSVFFLNFQVKRQFLSDAWKLQLAVAQTICLLTFRSNPAQAILSHPSPNSCILPWKLKLSVSIFHQYSVLHTPKSTWRSLLAYPFPFLEMPKQLCIPRTNPVLLKQKHLLKGGWLCRRNTFKESGSSCRISACSCTSTRVFQ